MVLGIIYLHHHTYVLRAAINDLKTREIKVEMGILIVTSPLYVWKNLLYDRQSACIWPRGFRHTHMNICTRNIELVEFYVSWLCWFNTNASASKPCEKTAGKRRSSQTTGGQELEYWETSTSRVCTMGGDDIVISHHIMSITSHHITSHHSTPHHSTSHHITSHHSTAQHITAQHKPWEALDHVRLELIVVPRQFSHKFEHISTCIQCQVAIQQLAHVLVQHWPNLTRACSGTLFYEQWQKPFAAPDGSQADCSTEWRFQ